MYMRRHPVIHFVVAVLLAAAAALITAAGPLLVLSTSFGVSPTMALNWNTDQTAAQTLSAEATQTTH
jgi:hypothetical protein